MLLFASIMNADASLLGAFVRAGLATVDLSIAQDALAGFNQTEATRAGTFN